MFMVFDGNVVNITRLKKQADFPIPKIQLSMLQF